MIEKQDGAYTGKKIWFYQRLKTIATDTKVEFNCLTSNDADKWLQR